MLARCRRTESPAVETGEASLLENPGLESIVRGWAAGG